MSYTTWIDGQHTDLLACNDRGLAYGDGVFETVRYCNGQLILADMHWSRLIKGCNMLGILIEKEKLYQQINGATQSRGNESGILKVIITRGSGGRGYHPANTTWRCIIQWFSLPDYPAENQEKGIHLYPCQLQLAIQPALAGIKHLNRLEQVMARSEWHDPSFAEGLLSNTEGDIIECTASNIFILHNNILITPEITQCGIAGVMRQWIIDNASCSVDIRKITLAMFLQAEEVFICNSVFGVWPVTKYKAHQWPVGKITRQIQRQVELLFND